MKLRLLSLFLSISVVLCSSLLFAQLGISQVPIGPQSGGSFGPARLYQGGSFGGEPSLVRSQWETTPRVGITREPGIVSQGSEIQKGDQRTTSSRTPDLYQFKTAESLPEPLSLVEAAFQDARKIRTPRDATDINTPGIKVRLPKVVRQFGYSLFNRSVSTFAPVEDAPVGPDYIVGPGDSLKIHIWGAMEHAVLRTVDREGQIFLPTVGPVRVWGLTFSQTDRLIRENLSRYFRGFETSVSMGRLRTKRIYVVGEVRQPGSYTVSSLSTMINALFAAGGPTKLGTLRKVELKRNQHTTETLDLYDFLLRGDKTHDFRLQSGDTIFIPPVGPVAAIIGEVKRPAIYELRGGTDVSELIEMAAGLTPRSNLKRVQVIRATPNAARELIDLDLTGIGTNGDSPSNIELRDGDLVRIFPTDPRIYNTVRLAGAVKQPGEYELKPGMRLSQLLPKEKLLPEAYADRVEIARLKNLTTNILSLDLRKAWAGDKKQDIILERSDLISVRSAFKAPGTVNLEGELVRPGSYRIIPGERLSSVIERAGGFTDKAFLKGAVFTRVEIREMEQTKLVDFVKSQEQRLLAEASKLTATSSGLSSDEAIAQQAVLLQRREQLKLVASRLILGRVVVHLETPKNLKGTENDLVMQNGDSLKVPQTPDTVVVIGSVRNPTAVIHKDDLDVEYYLNRAGGLAPEAAKKEIYLMKADGSAVAGFMNLRNIDPGDVVIVPPSTKSKLNKRALIKDLVAITARIALSFAALAAIF